MAELDGNQGCSVMFQRGRYLGTKKIRYKRNQLFLLVCWRSQNLAFHTCDIYMKCVKTCFMWSNNVFPIEWHVSAKTCSRVLIEQIAVLIILSHFDFSSNLGSYNTVCELFRTTHGKSKIIQNRHITFSLPLARSTARPTGRRSTGRLACCPPAWPHGRPRALRSGRCNSNHEKNRKIMNFPNHLQTYTR